MPSTISRSTREKTPAPRKRNVLAAAASEGTPEPREQIEVRAYHYFLERGGTHGQHLEDWLKAEADVVGPRRSPKARAQASA